MTRSLRFLIFVFVAGAFSGSFVGGGCALADSSSIKPFFGTYEGASLDPSAEVKPRDLKVSIQPNGDGGFRVEWQTTLYKPGEEGRTKTQSLEFGPAEDQPGIFRAVPSDVTAGMEPSEDPMDGAPYAWARVQGQVLTVNVLTISRDGDYVIQTYDRALTKNGMALKFMKVHNGQVVQQLWGSLDRVGG